MRFAVRSIERFERPVRLRMPFRFGMVTLTEAPQAFVRVRIRLDGGIEAEGASAQLMIPKWFEKNPAYSSEEDIARLRGSLAVAREAYLAGGSNTAWGHWQTHCRPGLVAGFGRALLDCALLDALCRALGVSVYRAVRANLIGAGDVEGLAMPEFLATLLPAKRIAARHTVGLLDPIAATDARERLEDGLPETLEEVVARYRQRYFKLKVAGEPAADLDRLAAIAAVLDRIAEPYFATLDGNEQFDDIGSAAEFWRHMKADRRLSRLVQSTLFIEQPVTRARALECPVTGIDRPVIIDESDDALDAFARARALGYLGVSSKTCKGPYKSLLNRARCSLWGPQYLMSGEDLTLQAGLALQQDLALVSLLGLAHVERNGHHYVNGMAGLPQAEQDAFLAAHPDLYERRHGAVRVRIEAGELGIASLGCAGFASATMPDWSAMQEVTG